MKESYWGYWLMVFGVFIIVVLLLIQSFTSTNTQDYYLIKEISEASMVDAIDYGYYRTYGELKMNKEKFYEVFLRRFAEEASLTTNYTIEFTEVYEAPPKIGVKVSSKSATFQVAGDTTTFDIVNKVDAILESKVDPITGKGSSETKNNTTPSEQDPVENPDNNEEDNKVKSSVNNFADNFGISQNLNQVININGYDVKMSCACGPIAFTQAVTMLGYKSDLQHYANYSGSNNETLAAATYIKMYEAGLNGNPQSGNTKPGDSFCGGKGNYKNSTSFLKNINSNLKVTSSGGTLNNRTGGYAEDVYKALLNGSVVVASIPNNTTNIPSSSALNNTNSGHYYTIYGYDATNNCFKTYNPMSNGGYNCASYDDVNKYFTEYVAIGNQ